MYNAEKVFARISKEYAELTGREYPSDLYKMEDAEVAVFMLKTQLQKFVRMLLIHYVRKALKQGLFLLTFFVPFPQKQIAEALKNVKSYYNWGPWRFLRCTRW